MIEQSEITAKAVNEAIRSYRPEGEKKKLMNLYAELITARRKVMRNADNIKCPHDSEGIMNRIRGGKPVLSNSMPEIDAKQFAWSLALVLNAVIKRSSFDKHRFKEFLDSLTEYKNETQDKKSKSTTIEQIKVPDWLRENPNIFEWQRSFADELSESYDLPYGFLSAVTRLALSPFLSLQSKMIIPHIVFTQWSKGICPVCGDLPVIGLMRSEDSLRLFECSMCSTRWSFSRVLCPSCMESNPQKLKYFFVEGDQSRRIYVCEGCKAYIKVTSLIQTVNESRFSSPLEDIDTVYLDMEAERKGFNPYCIHVVI